MTEERRQAAFAKIEADPIVTDLDTRLVRIRHLEQATASIQKSLAVVGESLRVLYLDRVTRLISGTLSHEEGAALQQVLDACSHVFDDRLDVLPVLAEALEPLMEVASILHRARRQSTKKDPHG